MDSSTRAGGPRGLLRVSGRAALAEARPPPQGQPSPVPGPRPQPLSPEELERKQWSQVRSQLVLLLGLLQEERLQHRERQRREAEAAAAAAPQQMSISLAPPQIGAQAWQRQQLQQLSEWQSPHGVRKHGGHPGLNSSPPPAAQGPSPSQGGWKDDAQQFTLAPAARACYQADRGPRSQQAWAELSRHQCESRAVADSRMDAEVHRSCIES